MHQNISLVMPKYGSIMEIWAFWKLYRFYKSTMLQVHVLPTTEARINKPIQQ